MKYCPNCGKELSAGVTRCGNTECGFQLGSPNKTDDMTAPVPKSDKLRMMEMEYELAMRGLAKGRPLRLQQCSRV